ncbi:MAG: YhdT family protein [Synergistes sp.]|nr:YhdT family protein [Synergistes sp.]
MSSEKISAALKKETYVIIVLYLLFFVWWYAAAYGFGDDASQYEYICGFPEWFFYSCIVGYVGISFILWAAVHFFFSDIPLNGEDIENE